MTPDTAKDPRVYLAAERTFLAWIRTGLSLMGFGFVVARFGLFLREMEFSQHMPLPATSPRFSLYVGTLLIVIGVLVNVLSAAQHVHFVRVIRSGQETGERPASMAVVVAITLALVGLAMAVYLLFVR
jgi:putative membrane protein